MDDTRAIARELYTAMERIGADAHFLGAISGWADGELPDEVVLDLLKTYNAREVTPMSKGEK
jgi:hypothetical protein